MSDTAEPDEREVLEGWKTRIQDRNWRLGNLYSIVDKNGLVVRFRPNQVQKKFWNNLWYVNLILKARQLGISTQIEMILLDACLFNSNTLCGIIDLSLDDAVKKLDKIKFAYDRLPSFVRDMRPAVKRQSQEFGFANGSTIFVGTSHRGGTLQYLHVSEYGKISARHPDKSKEIRTGAFGTINAGQFIFVESTAEGQSGDFYELSQRAEDLAKQGQKLSQVDFRFHFFAWWQDPLYRLDPETVVVPKQLDEYFAELEAKHRITLDPHQRAWYTAKRYQIGPDDMFREYPSIPEEAFFASIEGAYFKRQMTQARVDGRIGVLPHDPSRKVNTFWDIGNDTTAIWFHQTDGVRHRLIDYYENSGEQIPFYVKVVEDKAKERNFSYGKHIGPHDLMVTDWGGEGKTRFQRAYDLGIEFDIVPRVQNKDDAIDEGRAFLALCWIDEKHCAAGIQRLDNYRKRWNDNLGVWGKEPLHDWASHGADALMTGAMGFSPDDEMQAKPIDRHRRTKKQPKSAWAV